MRYEMFIKVTPELKKDVKGLSIYIQRIIDRNIGYKKGKLFSFKYITEGLKGDDFIINLHTIRVTYNVTKVPRIIKLIKNVKIQ